ncbi:MAG: hypothetical protein AABX55_01625, partial [Nanoarchaeota archaeon]
MNKEKIIFYLLIVLVIITVFNQFQLINLSKNTITGLTTGIQGVSALDVIPKGVPDIYGKELGISYDDVNVNDPRKADLTIKKLALFDTSINLESEKLNRYIKITNSISCEYCCGA